MSKLFKHARIISLFTGLSRILGLLREILMARFFGTSLAKSAFDIAFKIPNLFRRLFGEGALSAAFIPVFSETIDKEGPEAARVLAGRVFTLLATILTLITLSTIALITIAINNADLGLKWSAILPLLRIMFPYMLFICLVALAMGILNANMRFALPAATPIILNLVWIAALYLLCPRFGNSLQTRIQGVAWGILLAGIIQFSIQIPALAHCGMLPRISFRWQDPHIKRILLLMGPAALGMGIHQINVVIDGFLAIWVNDWAPAALTYSERLVYLPLGIFATALSTVLLPTFSKHIIRANNSEITKTINESIRGLMLIMIPAAAGLMVLAAPIVQLIFERGEFTPASTVQTARALIFYAPGLAVFSLYKILTPAFYAMKDTRTPVKIGIICVIANLALNIIFILTWPEGYRHAGLACATIIASALNSAILAIILSRKIGSPGWQSIALSFAKITLTAGIMAVSARLIYANLPAAGIFDTSTKTGQFLSISISIGSAMAIYTALALSFCRTECQIVIPKSRQK
jgi:putative peptidoglycan lipid II flippase